MIKDPILTIIHDFDTKAIPDFFDLKEYETDYEISRHLVKALRIGYIKKEETHHPEKAIYINFKKKYFFVSIFRKSIAVERSIFKDDYQNYDSIEDVYKKLLIVCKNRDSFSYD